MPQLRSGMDLDLEDVDVSANFSLALVVGKSHINRVVVSKIVERAGLKTALEAPETAASALRRLRPAVVILDGGPDNLDCDAALIEIAEQRRAFGVNLPMVILLSTRNRAPGELTHGRAIDAVVAKPFTPETLQPVVERLLSQVRD